MSLCVCVCASVQVCLIYLTDLYKGHKCQKWSVISAVWQCVLYEGYCIRKWEILTDTVQLYVNLSASSPMGYRVCQWMEVLWALSVSASLYLPPNLSEEWWMPLPVSNQCVRAICFDRLREMFDSEVPFLVQKGNGMTFLLCVARTCLTNWQSHYEKEKFIHSSL